MKVSNNIARSIYAFIFVLFVFCTIKFFTGNTNTSFQTVYKGAQHLSFAAQTLSDGSNINTLPIVIPSITVSKATNILANAEVKGVSDKSNFITLINDYRRLHGKTDLSTDESSCSFASTRSNEISSDFSHSGFESRRDLHTLPYSNWKKVVENIAMSTNGVNPVEMWKNSPVHSANMLSDIAFGCVQNNGNYFVFEGWKN